ncbi:hypothetical protein M501DRAFT_1005529 [Patellaria atrata CBS 101060]|uniref:Uncharacterized protein n=1 Tax=Patellaria atrata CBS 101060 TaxID=1346257 RepID=A0A9P4SJ69_9PEZI|nr:hypothetical protein M501DRAFT_1005529 [Patellaria atrata CBS 101060]
MYLSVQAFPIVHLKPGAERAWLTPPPPAASATPPSQLTSLISDLKSRLSSPLLPFGVDLALPQVGGSTRKTNTDYTRGRLDELIDIRLHKADIVVMNMVGHPRHAVKALEAGVDVVVLVPAVVDTARGYTSPLTGEPVIVVVVGGVWDGRGLAGALVQGAVGVWVGTRRVASVGAGCSRAHKDVVVEAGFGIRVNEYVRRWEERPEEIRSLTAAGKVPMVVDLGRGGRPAGEIVESMVRETVECLGGGENGSVRGMSKL